MLLMLSVRLAATIHYYLRAYAPANILLDRLRVCRRPARRIGIALSAAIAYLYASSLAATIAAQDGPGWLNMFVLIYFWNAARFAAMAAVTVPLVAQELGRFRR